MSEQADVRAELLPDHQATVVRILELRCGEPAVPWGQVARLLKLKDRELRRYRWLIAAERCAQGAGWVETGQHPGVDLNPDYLRKHHRRFKLPGGLSWTNYVGSYREALKRRTHELQAARGADMAERIHELAQQGLGILEDLQGRMRDYVDNPPALIAIGPKFSIDGREQPPQPTLFDSVEEGAFQQELQRLAAASIAVPPEEAPKPRLSVEAARYMIGMQGELTGGLRHVAAVLIGHQRPTPDEDEDAGASETELTELLRRGQELDAELAGYVGQEAHRE